MKQNMRCRNKLNLILVRRIIKSILRTRRRYTPNTNMNQLEQELHYPLADRVPEAGQG